MAGYKVDPVALRAWLEETCAEAGVPVEIEDLETLKYIAGLFAQNREEKI
jgi:hypothetical protein